MPASLEDLGVATGLEKVSFYSNLKERQYQRMFNLTIALFYMLKEQREAQNSPSEASTVCEL